MLRSVLLAVAVAGVFAGVPTPEESKRVLDKLSETEHFSNEHHNKQFDHDAFLGEDQAKTFDQLSPEESKRRLGLIVDKIDSDQDGYVSLLELKDWIRYTQKRYISEDVERHWRQHNPNNEELITWENYRARVYGFMEEGGAHEGGASERAAYSALLQRDRRRWTYADADQNDALNRTEFAAFLHPEDHPEMRDVVVLETMEDIDKDHDGKVSLEEYIGDMYSAEEGESGVGEEPEWVAQERAQFAAHRDANQDGHLDADEVRDWIAPPQFDHAEAEARHLVFEADTDADERLSKREVLLKYDLFVGSQATDFGEALARHDEF